MLLGSMNVLVIILTIINIIHSDIYYCITEVLKLAQNEILQYLSIMLMNISVTQDHMPLIM